MSSLQSECLSVCFVVIEGRLTSCHNYACIQSSVSCPSLGWWPFYGTPPPTDHRDKIELQWSKHKISPNNHGRLAAKLYFICGINSFPNSPSVLSTFSIPSLTTSAWSDRKNVKSKSDHYWGRSSYQDLINLWVDIPRYGRTGGWWRDRVTSSPSLHFLLSVSTSEPGIH